MKPTEVLQDEHRVIERVLDCLEAMAKEAGQHRKLDGIAAEQALDFFRNFADGCHHHKEEELLFPMLEANGLPRVGGPTGVMLYEHEEGRKFVGAMAAEIEAASSGNLSSIQSFVDAARGYVDLLRQHIDKEDHCLFPMVSQVLDQDKQRVLEEAFEDEMHAGMCEHSHQKYLDLADALCEKFGVAAVAHR